MKKVVILSTADFDSPVWTNKQHLAVGLAKDHEVIYIESLGLREPSLSPADVSRIIKKVVLRLLPGRGSSGSDREASVPKNIVILSPLVLPFHKYSMVRRINRLLLKRQLAQYLENTDTATLWTFSPLTYGLEFVFGNVIYHSVDLLHNIPRVPAAMLLNEERRLLERADQVVASSVGVKKHLENAGCKHVRLWENVAHVDIFAGVSATSRVDQAVFAGNLSLSKIDLECFHSILDSGLNLAVAGPINIDGSGDSSEIMHLLKDPRVKYHGNLTIPELASLFAESKVGLVPYQINRYTDGVFPMKIYEYLAAGLSVVSTPLPSLESEPIPNVHLVEPPHFGRAVGELVSAHDSKAAEVSVAASHGHSWEDRIRQVKALLAPQEELPNA